MRTAKGWKHKVRKAGNRIKKNEKGGNEIRDKSQHVEAVLKSAVGGVTEWRKSEEIK